MSVKNIYKRGVTQLFLNEFVSIHKTFLNSLLKLLKIVRYFCIDVTFEMRTVVQSNAFIQLITIHKIKLSFISETEKGAKGKIAERQRESKGERASVGWQQV